jgi:DEAD/DEAH box helicase domain-containing protein
MRRSSRVPGSIASFWQQAGRAGGLSAFRWRSTLLLTPLDQYFAAHPEYFLSRSVSRRI